MKPRTDIQASAPQAYEGLLALDASRTQVLKPRRSPLPGGAASAGHPAAATRKR
jgi:hypothetical protein